MCAFSMPDAQRRKVLYAQLEHDRWLSVSPPHAVVVSAGFTMKMQSSMHEHSFHTHTKKCRYYSTIYYSIYSRHTWVAPA